MGRTLFALGWVAVVLAGNGEAVASADSPVVEVAVAPDVPFTAEDLATALALRTADSPPANRGAGRWRIAVTASGDPGVVVVVVAGARRRVDLSGLTGSAAARRVAVVSLDLFHELPPPALARIEGTTPPRRIEPTLPIAEVVTTVIAPRPTGPPRVVLTVSAVAGGAGRGGAVGASVGIGYRWRVVAGAELAITDGAADLRATEVPIAAGLAVRWWRGALALETGVRLVAAPHQVGIDDGEARLDHTALRFGADASLSVALHLVGPVYADATGRFAGYGSRQRYQVGGVEVYATDWVDASIGVGLSVAMGSVR